MVVPVVECGDCGVVDCGDCARMVLAVMVIDCFFVVVHGDVGELRYRWHGRDGLS